MEGDATAAMAGEYAVADEACTEGQEQVEAEEGAA